MADFDLALKGATVVSPHGRAPLHCYVRDGLVAHIGPESLDAARVVDAAGLYLLPGMVDTHVHLMDPGATDREDFPTGTAAAARAGVTTVVEHTHARPVRSGAELREKRTYLEGRSVVDYGLAAHVWPDRLDDLAGAWREGATFFKVFTCTTHGVPGLDAASLLGAFRRLADLGAPCLVHCEDESLTAAAERELRAAGREDPAVICAWRSREAELVAVAVVTLLARLTRARVTIAHVSSPPVAALVAEAQTRGADVGAEACPQYFTLREDEILTHRAFRKFTPPARARTDADVDDMWRLLRDGVLTHVATDHAPATAAQKTEAGIWDAHFGLPGLDTTMPLLIDAAAGGRVSLEDVAEVYAAAPARRYGLGRRKGRLAPGSDADMVLVDLAGSQELRDADVRSKAGWTPYAGRQVRGSVVATYLRGRPVAEAGEVTADRPGTFLPGGGGR